MLTKIKKEKKKIASLSLDSIRVYRTRNDGSDSNRSRVQIDDADRAEHACARFKVDGAREYDEMFRGRLRLKSQR